jgi:hypothetical protein
MRLTPILSRILLDTDLIDQRLEGSSGDSQLPSRPQK